VSNRYGTNHHEIHLNNLIISDLVDRVSSFYDEPFGDPSIIPTYLVSLEASKSCKVVLNGEGSDELFGGYRRYFAARYIEQLNSIFPHKSVAILSRIFNFFPPPINYRGMYSNFLRTIRPSAKKYIDAYISLTSDGLDSSEKESYLIQSKKIYSQISKESIEDIGKDYGFLMRFMFTDFFTGMRDCLLSKIDMCTMANSIEGRSPFLDVNIVEYAFKLKRSELFGRNTKQKLRDFSKNYLPDSIVNAPKRGFEPPYHSWIDNELSSRLRDICHNKNSIVHNYLDDQVLRGIYNNKIEGIDSHRRYKLLWTFLMLDSWSSFN
jgi:asparagine synthase (glutamine-hydrolysing)